MKFKDTLDDYDKLIEEVKALDLPIEVTFGLEVCYVPKHEKKIGEVLANHNYDFVVGAIHSINGRLYDMNFSKDILWNKFDVDDIYRDYYELIFSLVKSDLFTQLAHPDTIKMFNYYPTYDLTPTYHQLADLLVEHNVKAENNALAQDANWKNEKLKVGDVVYRNYDGFVTQEGVFGQVEFNRNALATFIAGSVSNTMYWRYDRFYYDKAHAKSGKADFWSGTVKGGANYNLDEHNNVFANIGFISKAPFFEYAVFLNKENSNELNKDAVNEKIFSVELGYGFRSPVFTANLNLYRTAWMDKSMGASVTFQDSDERGRINMTGVDALHQGVELEVTVKPVRNLELTGMLSLADWRWNSYRLSI